MADEDDIEIIEQEKKKLVMDFRAKEKHPERVTMEVLKDMVRSNPESMGRAARKWVKE